MPGKRFHKPVRRPKKKWRKKKHLNRFFPNPLEAPVGVRKLSFSILCFTSVICLYLLEIIIGFTCVVYFKVDASRVKAVFGEANHLFEIGIPLILTVYGVTNALEWKYRGMSGSYYGYQNYGQGYGYNPSQDVNSIDPPEGHEGL